MQAPTPDGTIIERVASGPLGGDLIRAPASDAKRLIIYIYFHGGGFLFSSHSHRVVVANLALLSIS
ncbi:hypothetical protein [Bradyrhizobium uaiense]|uniref:Alpha/beta hydrolase n=1 Tax=Bradyrhizobium uaiense TaxID=2594946 RepID=A0A6P1BUU1_9BRAD|nr:hypothetical protein [Bradyrhizobium uaiense]NEV02267.1 hypothetical protein [Bradyrhizobium uaiense]